MRNSTFFPTYSQTENVVTNAVLVLLSQVYRLAPDVFAGLLTKMSDAEIVVGPQFFNQVTDARGPGIPDGLVEQSPFRIYLETKLGDALDASQIKRHFETIKKRDGERSGSVLIGLTRSPLDAGQLRDLRTRGIEKGVIFASTTFSALADLVAEDTAEFRLELNSLVTEFRTFIQEQNLAEPSENWMLVNPCGATFNQNAKFRIYHDQPGRSKRFCKYLGCYHDKAVRVVGRLNKVVVAHVERDQLVVDENYHLSWSNDAAAELTQEETTRIIDMIKSSPYRLDEEVVRYYLVENFVKTDFRKTSPGGIRGHTYFKLDGNDPDEPGYISKVFQNGEPSIEEIAEALGSRTWT